MRLHRALGLAVASLLLATAAQAVPGSGTKQTRTVVPLDRGTVAKHFPGQNAATVNTNLRAGRWRPDESWLRTEGKKYGRLLIVSDLHPSTGQDLVTRKVNPSEDFKPNQQEVDFRRMMQSEWSDSKKDGRARTLVLNGDTLEFMQTSRARVGQSFGPGSDRYGPLNTPQNIVAKLRAIYDGHPVLFGTYAEHIYRGNRVVFIPGNHDRQTLHPTVRKVAVMGLTRDVGKLLVADKTFMPGAGIHKRKKLAALEAKRMVQERLEFHPWFFVVGDVVARHGHETDKYNAFSTPFGEYYHPGAKNAPMEAALGDYIVKGVFNKIERRQPWTDNTSSSTALAKAVVRAADGNPVKAGRFLSYLLTREGGPATDKARARAEARKDKDVRRYVRDFGLLAKFNTIRPPDQRLTEDQLVATLKEYESAAAKPALSNFKRGQGALRRMGKLATLIPGMLKSQKSSDRERAMSDILFRDLYASTLAVGHDHAFRAESKMVLDKKTGKAARATVLDTATWTDQLPEVRRDTGFVPNERRGVLVVDFDAKGSHPQLMNYDPARGGLHRVMIVESETEAKQ